MKVLLIQPPLTQLNTCYPAITQLTGFLKSQQISCAQVDLSIEFIRTLFTKQNLEEIFQQATGKKLSKAARHTLNNAPLYLKTIDPAIRFLSGLDATLATRIGSRNFLPEGKRFKHLEDLEWTFGTMGSIDKAKHLATLYLHDVCDFIGECVSPHVELVRYAQKLCTYLPDFTPLQYELESDELNKVDELMLRLLKQHIDSEQPQLVGFSIPFPGNLYAALRCAKMVKEAYPAIKIVAGGGYINTELRQVTDKTIFNYIDYLTFDDGELPLLRLTEYLQQPTSERRAKLVRTFCLSSSGDIERIQPDSTENIPFNQLPAPDYSGIDDSSYLNLVEQANPMHQLWSNGRWNKLMLAHGCYWAKCTFCDTSLDYIRRYEPSTAQQLVDRMEQVMAQTGESGFHFTDEAAPPNLLRQLAEEILSRGLVVSYWTNVRFDNAFTPDLCYLLASSGCIAVSGGLEVASNRILQLISKGVTVETASQCLKNFSDAGILTHAYLMYGFPSQTMQETVESLEVVRRLFEQGYLQSAFWHQYAMTVHSPSGQQPDRFGARHIPHPQATFANNEIPFEDDTDIENFEHVGAALRLATHNYMQGVGFDMDAKEWFRRK